MATLDVTLTFDSDAQGLDDTGGNANAVFSWLSSDGSPSNGCMKFAVSNNAGSALALKTSTADTWETLGIPAGATVTGAQLVALLTKKAAGAESAAVASLSFDLVDASGTRLLNLGLAGYTMGFLAGSWTDQGAATSRTVLAGSQASNSPVRIKAYGSAFSQITTPYDVRFDGLKIRLTYTISPFNQTWTPGTLVESASFPAPQQAYPQTARPLPLLAFGSFPIPTWGGAKTWTPDTLIGGGLIPGYQIGDRAAVFDWYPPTLVD